MKALLVIVAIGGFALATNGDNLIGVTPASRAMGGIGVGMPLLATDAPFRNPAWMRFHKGGYSFSFGGILFAPSVKARIQNPLGDSGTQKSKSDLFIIPEVGLVAPINERLSLGLGAFGVSGLGVDYVNNERLVAAFNPRNNQSAPLNMRTNFQFLRIIPSASYQLAEGLYLGGGIHLAYGALSMGATLCGDASNPLTCFNAGGAQAQNYGLGFQLGIAYAAGDFAFVGATYQSPVAMTYRRVFDSNGDGRFESFKLTQPQEFAVGFGLKPYDNLKVGTDIRFINWKGASGYKHFGWEDQLVFAIGGEYKPSTNLALRLGYNYGRSPIRGKSGLQGFPVSSKQIPNFAQPFGDFNIAFFNLVGFPAIAEQHLTFGIGYNFSKSFGIDLSYKHAFNKKVTSSGIYYDAGACRSGCPTTVSAQNAQNAISLGLNWQF